MAKKMNKTIKIILAIAIGAAIFAIGIFVGMAMAKKSVATNGGQLQPALQNILGNPVVSSISASGKLASVSGLTITIVSGSNTLTIATDANTKIRAYENAKDAQGNIVITTKNILLSDLKAGDYLNANINVLSPNQLVATSINRISPASGN